MVMIIGLLADFHSRGIYGGSFSGLCYYYSCNSVTDMLLVVVWGTSSMFVCFQRNLMIFAKARPAQMIFITTSIENYNYVINIFVLIAIIEKVGGGSKGKRAVDGKL